MSISALFSRMGLLGLFLIITVLGASNAQAQQVEKCANGIDDDGDSLVDKDDQDCVALYAKADELKSQAEARKKAEAEAKSNRPALIEAAKAQLQEAEVALKAAEGGNDFAAIQEAKRRVEAAKNTVKSLGGSAPKARKAKVVKIKSSKPAKGEDDWSTLPAPNADESLSPSDDEGFKPNFIGSEASIVFLPAANGKLNTANQLDNYIVDLVDTCPGSRVLCEGYASEGAETSKVNGQLAKDRTEFCLQRVRLAGGVAFATSLTDAGNAGDGGRGVRLSCAPVTTNVIRGVANEVLQESVQDEVQISFGWSGLVSERAGLVPSLAVRADLSILAVSGSIGASCEGFLQECLPATSISGLLGHTFNSGLRVGGGAMALFVHWDRSELEHFQVAPAAEVGYLKDRISLVGQVAAGPVFDLEGSEWHPNATFFVGYRWE